MMRRIVFVLVGVLAALLWGSAASAADPPDELLATIAGGGGSGSAATGPGPSSVDVCFFYGAGLSEPTLSVCTPMLGDGEDGTFDYGPGDQDFDALIPLMTSEPPTTGSLCSRARGAGGCASPVGFVEFHDSSEWQISFLRFVVTDVTFVSFETGGFFYSYEYSLEVWGQPTSLVACAAGSFSETGYEPCTEAPAGSFVDIEGAVSATPCPLGTYSDVAGAVSCTRAPKGSYVAGSGATEPTECPADQTTVGIGSTSVDDCIPIDTDGDGVPDVVDVCPGTVLPDQPTSGLKKNRYLATIDGFVSTDGVVIATMADTGGCSATQIIQEAGLGQGHTKFGISKSALDSWISGIAVP